MRFRPLGIVIGHPLRAFTSRRDAAELGFDSRLSHPNLNGRGNYNTMSGIWNRITRALLEGNEKEQLLSYITRKYGEYDAEELRPQLDKLWNPQQLPAVARHLQMQWADPQVGEIMRKAMASMGIDSSGNPSVKRGRGRPPGSGSGAGQKSKEPPPPEKKYVDPDQAKATAAKAAEVGASRPDRASGAGSDPFSWVKDPRQAPAPADSGATGHQFGGVRGTSPGHTRPPQVQPSQDKIPSKMGRELEPLKAKEKELSRQVAGLSADPSQKMAAERAKGELAKVQQQIARISQAGSSGVEDAQKRVDYLNQTYPDSLPGDKIAKQLGVPTTRERTRKVIGPDGNEKKVVQIWNADKVFNYLNRGGSSEKGTLAISPELKPGKFDLPGGPELPVEPTGKRQKGDAPKAVAGVQKPMMKAPKGLDDAGKLQLSQLRGEFSKAKKSNDAEKMADLKGQIDKIMASSNEIEDVVRPGTRVGQRWKPHGVSQKVKTTRADQATGNFQYGSRFTNPAEEGGELVWNGKDWVTDGAMGAKEGTVHEGRVWTGLGWVRPSIWVTRRR